MNRRRTLGLVVGLVVLAWLAAVIPGSPAYLPRLIYSGGYYDGHFTRFWLRALHDPDLQTRRHAIHALGAIGADAADAVPELGTIILEDPDRGCRIEASLALGKIGPAALPALSALARALTVPDPVVRRNVAIALGQLGPAARPAVPALVTALNDEDNQTNAETFFCTVQERVAISLGRASAGTADAVPALSATLRSAFRVELRAAAARALGEIGPPAAPAAPLLRALLRDKNQDVHLAATEALQKIGTPATGDVDPSLAATYEDLELPEAKRRYLWEIEHHGNLLVKHGFGALATALTLADAAALTRLLADDFIGTDLGEPRCIRTARSAFEVERLEDAGHPPRKLNRAAFVNRLLEFRKVFSAAPPHIKFALMTFHPKVRGQLDGPWEGTAQMRLNGEQAPGAPAEVVAELRYEVSQPTEGSLARPGWLHEAGVTQVAIAKAPHYLFTEVARQRGLDASRLHDNWTAPEVVMQPGGVFVCDFDRDGILDVLITDVTGCILYRGRPDGTFADVTAQCGLPSLRAERTAAAWVDIDGDGWPDLILAGRIYRNEGGKHFTDYTRRSNLRLPGDAGNIAVADYDHDGRLDLYVTRSCRPGSQSWLDGRSGDPRGNFLYRNLGNWQFEDVTKVSGTGGSHRSTFTAAWLDANNDGWPDLHVINEFGDGVLLINNQNGTFTEHALADHPADFGSMGLAVGDINNDGNIDIFCANMYSKAGARVIGNLAPGDYPPRVLEKMRRFVGGSQLHLNRGGLHFDQVGKQMQVAAVGWSYGACLADLDNDGWLDVYATAGFMSRDRTEPDG